jgi:hypothetical protein
MKFCLEHNCGLNRHVARKSRRLFYGTERKPESELGQIIMLREKMRLGVYDKLLIVLSESSLQSEWVMTELRNGRRKQMAKSTCYTPQLSREIVSRLYFRAKAECVPMTVLANRIMENALAKPESIARFLPTPEQRA